MIIVEVVHHFIRALVRKVQPSLLPWLTLDKRVLANHSRSISHLDGLIRHPKPNRATISALPGATFRLLPTLLCAIDYGQGSDWDKPPPERRKLRALG